MSFSTVVKSGKTVTDARANDSVRIYGVAYNLLNSSKKGKRKMKPATMNMLKRLSSAENSIELDTIRAKIYRDEAVLITASEAKNMTFVGGDIKDTHNNETVGTVTDHWVRGSDLHIVARVDDPDTITKIRSGEYTCFSVGYNVNHVGGTVVDKLFREISVCNKGLFPGCSFDVIASKSRSSDDLLNFVRRGRKEAVLTVEGTGSFVIDERAERSHFDDGEKGIQRKSKDVCENKNNTHYNERPSIFRDERRGMDVETQQSYDGQPGFSSRGSEDAIQNEDNKNRASYDKNVNNGGGHKNDRQPEDDGMSEMDVLRAKAQKRKDLKDRIRQLEETNKTYANIYEQRRQQYASSREPHLKDFKTFYDSFKPEGYKGTPEEDQLLESLFTSEDWENCSGVFTSMVKKYRELDGTNKRMGEQLEEQHRQLKRLKKNQEMSQLAKDYKEKKMAKHDGRNTEYGKKTKPPAIDSYASRQPNKVNLSELFKKPQDTPLPDYGRSNQSKFKDTHSSKEKPLTVKASRTQIPNHTDRFGNDNDVQVPSIIGALLQNYSVRPNAENPLGKDGHVFGGNRSGYYGR